MTESPAAPLLRHLLAPLDEWRSDAATEEICINAPHEAWLRQRGEFRRHEIPLDLQDLESIAILAGALRRQGVGPDDPILDAELPDGERLHVQMHPTVPMGAISLTFRKPGAEVAPLTAMRDRYRIADDWNRATKGRGPDDAALLCLYDAGDMVAFLAGCVRARQNVLLVGRQGSGKTSLLKTLITEIDHSERIITVEDAMELVVPQPNHVRLLFQRNDLDDERIDPDILLQGTLRMRPDRVLLGEIRGKEAWTLVNEVAPVHPGSLSSIHGHDAASGFKRLFALCYANDAAPKDRETLLTLVAGTVDVLVPMYERGGVFSIGNVWFRADALRRGESAADLLEKD
jgi:type IV secretion system protein VirB11